MAEYIINTRVIFNNEMCSLYLIENSEEKTIISTSASRLLTLFINNNNTLITRDKILTEVWEKHGLVPSTNNLYHSISVIRKSLANLGEDNIIITMPKVGFSMRALSIVMDDDDGKSNLFFFEENLSTQNNHSRKLTESKSCIKKTLFRFASDKVTILIAAGVTVFAVFLTTFYSHNFNISKHYINYPMTGKIDKCNIYSLKKISSAESMQAIDYIKFKIDEYKLNCNKDADIYYSYEEGYKLIHYCTFLSGGTPDPNDCFNIIADNEASL